MILDWIASTGCYVLRVARGEADAAELMRDHGLDFSRPRSTAAEAVLFTKEPYAAVSFFKHGTAAAREQLASVNSVIEQSRAPTSQAHIKVPAGRELWGFQKAGVEYALNRNNTLLGDQPGLGKTEIAIAYANEIGARRVLVICPASIRAQWCTRIREWSTMAWPYVVHPVMTGSKGIHPGAAWTVVSYDLARTPAIGKALTQGTYDVLILDEAHYLKTVDAARTRAIFGGGRKREFGPIADRCGTVLALTGTPLPNRPREAYTLARGLCFDAIDWLSEERFRDRYNPSNRWREEVGRTAELQNRLRANFMVRHLKRDPEVARQIGLTGYPRYEMVHALETGAVKAALAHERLLDIDPNTLRGRNAEIDGEVATARREMGEAIAPQLADYVAMLVDGGEEKIVVFYHHISVGTVLQQKLDRLGCLRVDGSTSAARKTALVERFQADPRMHVMIGNELSLGTGTDGLQTVCSHAILGEPDWVIGNNQQCFDRLDRGGQANTCQFDIFVAPGSLAERILATSLYKGKDVFNTLDRRT